MIDFSENPFQSFWMAGFESSDQLNVHGNRMDFLRSTGHLLRLREDYAMLETYGIKTVREGLRWSQVEKYPYQYDFSTFQEMLTIGKEHNIQQIWDICHFGFPDDLYPLHPHFTERFVALCRQFANFYSRHNDLSELIVTPINEVSFLSWLGGDVAGTAPYCRNNGWEVKYSLMKAYIEGIKAIKEIHPGIRILTTEPLTNIVPVENASQLDLDGARRQHELQFQMLEMLTGKICPELGGSPELADLLGFNYYYNNQWVYDGNKDRLTHFLGWNDIIPDIRWVELSDLLRDAYLRYGKPIVLTETSHPGIDRPIWIQRIDQQCDVLLKENIPLYGVCIYPIIDRHDWDHLDHWHNSGLWDYNPADGVTSRVLHEPSHAALLAVISGKQSYFETQSFFNQRFNTTV